MNRITAGFAALTICLVLPAAPAAMANSLEASFRDPPEETRPWCYWYWINDNISREGVTKDLEAMARVGIGTALIGNQWFADQPQGPAPVLGETWWDITAHAVREGKRLGVDIGLFNCPGWSMSGGPWVEPEQAMRYLAHSEKRVRGPVTISEPLPPPGENFQDVALLAVPVPDGEGQALAARGPTVSCVPEVKHAGRVADGDPRTGINLPDHIEIKVPEAFTARSVTLFPGEGHFRTEVTVQAWVDEDYRTIREGTYDRRTNRPDVGPMPEGPVILSLPPTTTDRFRLVFSAPEAGKRPSAPGTISEIEISPAARVEYAVEKQLGKMFPRPLPLWGDYLWPDAPEPRETRNAVNPGDVLDFTGQDTVVLPEGDWIIQRIGMLPTGVQNGPAAPHATGLEVDKMNRKHLGPHFDAFVGALLERLTPEERVALKYIVSDSYEKGSQNWTDDLRGVFAQTYGYNPIPFLPALSGRVVRNAEASDRFLWDLRRLVADRLADEYVAGLRELCQQHNMKLWLENYGHWGFPGEFMRYGGACDLISGEFWVTGTLGNIECRAAASTAHAYGKPVVYAEAFTSGDNWQFAPFDLKARGDWAFTEGINHFVLHLYIQQPNENVPGMNAWFGTEFNRHNTWFDEGRDWLDYLRRCHVLLQHGLHVADFAYFIGEDAPIMTGTRHPEQPAGYDFDFVNAEVLLERMTVKNGRWTLPDGKSYAVLVLPPLDTMRPAVIRKLHAGVEAGGVLYGTPPRRSPSLRNAAEADRIVQRVANKIWQSDRAVFKGGDLQTVVDALQLGPDVSGVDPETVLWTHRQTPEMDIYFVSNQQDETVALKPVFRVPEGRTPEFWHADSGHIERMGQYASVEHGLEVPLTLHPYGSVFVVFRAASDASELPWKTRSTALKAELTIDKHNWSLSFLPGRDVPEIVELSTLGMWTDLDDEAVVHYSGTAAYRTTFMLSSHWTVSEGERQFLDLGRVAPMARVHLNGQDLGLLWKPPYRVEVTGVLRAGENHLRIDVTNLWNNRMLGERDYPDGFPGSDGRNEFQPTRSLPSRKMGRYRLMPSGLEGPVSIEHHVHAPMMSAGGEQ